MNNSPPKHGNDSGQFKKYWRRRFIYNAPMLLDQLYQPFRFGTIYLISHSALPPLVRWLKSISSPNHTPWSSSLHHLVLQPIATVLLFSSQMAYQYLCPSLLKPHIVHPFEWNPYHFTIANVLIAYGGVSISYLRSYFHFKQKSKGDLKWPVVYDYMMNQQFSEIIKESLKQHPLSDNFHIEITLKLYPIIKFNYFDSKSFKSGSHSTRSSKSNATMSTLSELNVIPNVNDSTFPRSSSTPKTVQQRSSPNVYELKIVQFTAANVAWYSTKWNRVSIQREQHRLVGVFLCDYDPIQSDEARKAIKKEIRESIMKFQRMALDELKVEQRLEWSKSMCLALQYHFGGEWITVVGHKAQCRSFHSVILRQVEMDYDGQYQGAHKVPLNVNEKTDAEFFHFGFGPKCMGWSVVIAKIE